MKQGAKVLTCTCKHEGQDKIHGKGNRVFNPKQLKANAQSVDVTCTVCGSVKTTALD